MENVTILDPIGLRPMLAGKFEFSRVRYPVFAQPKYDGIRMLVKDGIGLSRTLKPIPNRFVQKFVHLVGTFIEGLDGELIVGSPTDKNAMQATSSGVMSQDGEPDFTYYVFDMWNSPGIFPDRYTRLQAKLEFLQRSAGTTGRLALVPTHLIGSEDGLIQAKADFLAEGYEGAIVRHPETTYKFGRSTAKEGALLKFKDFEDAEAIILDFEELYSNQNEATLDAMGLTKRSAHQANKFPMGMLGALVVFQPGKWEGRRFNIGTGFDMALRQKIWDNRVAYIGNTVKFKYLPTGVKDVPRHPVFLGFRHPEDT